MKYEFITQLINPANIPVTGDDIGRIYHIHGNKYYSVTTFLSHCADRSFLERWEKTVTDPEKIVRQAGKLGTDFHSLGEAFLLGETLPKVQWMASHMFAKTVPILEKNVSCVKAVELVLWSDLIRLAGRTDALVEWNGELAILDFKCIGSHNPEFIHHHWLQLCTYAHMVEFMYGLKPKKLVLVCANKKSLTVKEFISTPKEHAKETVTLIKKFHEYIKRK